MRAAFAITSVIAVALGLTCLVTSSPLSPRDQTCANDGTTKAGTIFEHRSLDVSSLPAPLEARTIRVPCNWCLAGTATFLAMRAFAKPGPHDPPGVFIQELLLQLLEYMNELIRREGDGLIEHGSFRFSKFGIEWFVFNENNHQTTRGVMRTAVLSMIDFCRQNGQYGYAGFTVYDGLNQVARGVVRPTPASTP